MPVTCTFLQEGQPATCRCDDLATGLLTAAIDIVKGQANPISLWYSGHVLCEGVSPVDLAAIWARSSNREGLIQRAVAHLERRIYRPLRARLAEMGAGRRVGAAREPVAWRDGKQ
jgi:hypothetical protein